jgi:hypothetical protein
LCLPVSFLWVGYLRVLHSTCCFSIQSF